MLCKFCIFFSTKTSENMKFSRYFLSFSFFSFFYFFLSLRIYSYFLYSFFLFLPSIPFSLFHLQSFFLFHPSLLLMLFLSISSHLFLLIFSPFHPHSSPILSSSHHPPPPLTGVLYEERLLGIVESSGEHLMGVKGPPQQALHHRFQRGGRSI